MTLRRKVPAPSLRNAAVTLGTLVVLTIAGLAARAPIARASGVPDPGGPGPMAFPAFSATTFGTPPAATRVKFRWWQPVADINDAQIQSEVKTMAGNFGGGFEQNGFPVSNAPETLRSGFCNGCTPQFMTFAAGQQFLQQYGWGSPLWSHRTQIYQQAAAQNGVIGDMNEGSRWDNTAPTVYSPNQEADAQDLSYGVRQYQPGQNPSGELPTMNAPALGGESTTLTVQANPGDTNIQVQSIAGLLAGDQATLGQGSAAETATIKSVGTPSPAVPLSQPARAGSSVIHVAPASTTTGVPGTGQAAAQFVPGESVTIGSGADAEKDTIASIGTYDVANPTTLVLPPGASGTVAAPAGATNVEVASTSNFLKGDTITIGTGSTAESRTITSVGGSASGTTLSAAASAGDLQISVASVTGLLAGQYITIGQGTSQDVDKIATISGNTLILYTRVQNSHTAGDPVALKSIGVTFTPALNNSHEVGETAIDTGTGIILKTPLAHDHPAGDNFIAPGTGVTLTAPLSKTHLVGANDATSTTLSAPAAANATNIKVASVTHLAPGDKLTIGQPGYIETVTIQTIGSAGATGTGVMFSPALSKFHYSGDPVVDATNGNVTNASGGVSDIEHESLVAALLVQCLPPSIADSEVPQTTSLSAAATAGATTITVGSASNLAVGDWLTIGTGATAETKTISAITGTTVTLDSGLGSAHASGEGVWDTCTSAPTGGTRELDPATTINVTSQVKANALNFTEGSLNYTSGSLPAGNGQRWELIDFYLHGDTQTNSGGTATTPNQWLGHLSVASANAMADYFDHNILNDPSTQAAIAYQGNHTGTPAVFEDSLENDNNVNWVPEMISSWRSDVGYDPTLLLPALAATGRNAIATPAFDFPQSDGQGATLGWRVRDDYGQMWNDLYINNYLKTLDDWANSHGLVARFQSYGDPIDEGEASANEGIAETEHLEMAGVDETQQFKVAASGTFQDSSPHFLSDECCEAPGVVWADPFGIDGTGSGPSPDATEPNAESVYADEAGGDSQIIYHGWPYTIGAAGTRALWPGNTYGGDDSYSAANGPNQPQFADDRNNNVNVARRALILRQGEASFDVAVFHEDFGLGDQGQDTGLANGWDMGTVTSNGVTTTPTSGKVIRSSSSLAQAGYLYGYVSPAFFRYLTATFATDPLDGNAGKVLFPGRGDYRSLLLYDQSVMPVDVAQKIAALAGQGLPIVIVGQVPNAAPNASGGTLVGMRAADAQVQAAMAKITASPNTKVVTDSTAANSQSSDANAPDALKSLGIDAATQMNTPSAVSGTTATPVLGIRRHARNLDYYQLLNMSPSSTVHPSVTLTGSGVPYLLDTWSGKIEPIANYTESRDRVTLSLRIGPANAIDIAITPGNDILNAKPPGCCRHATSTTANATSEAVDNVVYNSAGQLIARASTSGTYTTTLSDGSKVTSDIKVPAISPSSTVSLIGGTPTLTNWDLSVDSWTQTPSGDPTQTLHTPIPVSGTIPVSPLSGVSDGSLPSWTAITPQNIPGLDPGDNLTNAAGIGTYTTSFTLPSDFPTSTAGAYLNVGAAVDTVDIWVNGTKVDDVDENDRNQVGIGPYLRPGSNDLKITVATPLRNAVAVAPATPATGQVANSSETIGSLQGGAKIANVGLIGPVTLKPYGQSAPLQSAR